jgi:class 3 adenylate cyclase
MPRIPILRLGRGSEQISPPKLISYIPALSLEGLQLGVDNLRHDVYLSPRFTEQVRVHVAQLIVRYGNLEGVLAAETTESATGNQFLKSRTGSKPAATPAIAGLKPLLGDLHIAALNRAKAADNLSVDLLGRLAIIKFLRIELNLQFAQLLERGRMMLRNFEGLRQQKALEYRERIAGFQVAKRIILRKAGQDLFRILRDLEKESLARMRRALCGNRAETEYKLFLNPLIYTEDGRDAYLTAEQYVMLGTFERDPDRFAHMRKMAIEFLSSLAFDSHPGQDHAVEGWLNVPENAQELVGSGDPDDSSLEARSRKLRLQAWTEHLEREGVMEHIIASYEVVPLLSEYSPRINPQQLKNALICREERVRVERLIEEHGRLTCDNLYAAMARVEGCRGAHRAKVAGRFLRDFFRYHRDLRRLEALNAALDSVNLVAQEKIRELSAMNGTLYEFRLGQEQKPSEEKVSCHVILKADIRDSSRLTRSLLDRGLNPASYFSLNFYDPVNKVLGKYGARKVFVEGDALILVLFEYAEELTLPVSRACVLAREIIEIVRGYNQLLDRAGLPSLELGIGISFQDSPPMYLMDGERPIMISDALNESDRLCSSSRRVRQAIRKVHSPFNIYAFETAAADDRESAEDCQLKYNVNGIRMSEPAFKRLQQEISLEVCALELPELWGSEGFKLYSAMVPIGNDIFRKILVRASRIPRIENSNFALEHWTERSYYEVCSNAAVYEMLERKAAATK